MREGVIEEMPGIEDHEQEGALVSTTRKLLRGMLVNDVVTGASQAYPELEPRRYEADPEQVSEALVGAIGELERWEMVRFDARGGVYEATRTTRWMRFTDDITARVIPEAASGRVRVEVRSASRVGTGDLGQNARNIEELFEALDARLEG